MASNLKVRRIGTGPQAVVLVHGFGNSAMMWLPYIWPLRSRFTFYLPDLPGFGNHRSELPDLKRSVLSRYADYLKEVIDSTGSDHVYLAGYSLGALTSLQLHAQGGFAKVARYLHIDHSPCPKRMAGWDGGIHPRLWEMFHEVESLVEKQPEIATWDLEKLPEPLLGRYLALLETLGEKSITRPTLRKLNAFLHRAPVVKKLVAGRASWPWAYAVILGYLRGDFDFRATLKDLKVPTTVVSGVRSELFGETAVRAMKEAMPCARFVEFRQSGHDLVFNEPSHFAAVLREFLTSRE